MRFDIESWRKLYVRKTASWLRLRVSARGLGRELLTYCDDQGRIEIGDDKPGVAVAFMLGARPAEHKQVIADVDSLIAYGYLDIDGGELVIRNFVQAQDRTPAAKRTAEWRARRAEEASGTSPPITRETSHVTSHVTSRVPTNLVTDTSQEDPNVTTYRDRDRDRVEAEGGTLPQATVVTESEILAELRRHRSLAIVSTPRFASALVGVLMGKPKPWALVAAAIEEASVDIAGSENLTGEAIAKKVRTYVGAARAPREVAQDAPQALPSHLRVLTDVVPLPRSFGGKS